MGIDSFSIRNEPVLRVVLEEFILHSMNSLISIVDFICFLFAVFQSHIVPQKTYI